MSLRLLSFVVGSVALPDAQIVSNYTGIEQGGLGLSSTAACAALLVLRPKTRNWRYPVLR